MPIRFVFARGGRPRGRLTGRTKRCTLVGCGGVRHGVRWTSGKITWPCGKGLTTRKKDGQWQIGFCS